MLGETVVGKVHAWEARNGVRRDRVGSAVAGTLAIARVVGPKVVQKE